MISMNRVSTCGAVDYKVYSFGPLPSHFGSNSIPIIPILLPFVHVFLVLWRCSRWWLILRLTVPRIHLWRLLRRLIPSVLTLLTVRVLSCLGVSALLEALSVSRLHLWL
jgi:hypothetical protein